MQPFDQLLKTYKEKGFDEMYLFTHPLEERHGVAFSDDERHAIPERLDEIWMDAMPAHLVEDIIARIDAHQSEYAADIFAYPWLHRTEDEIWDLRLGCGTDKPVWQLHARCISRPNWHRMRLIDRHYYLPNRGLYNMLQGCHPYCNNKARAKWVEGEEAYAHGSKGKGTVTSPYASDGALVLTSDLANALYGIACECTRCPEEWIFARHGEESRIKCDKEDGKIVIRVRPEGGIWFRHRPSNWVPIGMDVGETQPPEVWGTIPQNFQQSGIGEEFFRTLNPQGIECSYID